VKKDAQKTSNSARRLSSNIKKDYPILQVAVYDGVESVNKIIELP
jgi:hypothetical protein